MKNLLLLVGGFAVCSVTAHAAGLTHSLFDGDLSAWDTWLGIPHKSMAVPGLARNETTGEYTAVIGENRDPLGVFSVAEIDGAKAIRISGQVFGALTSKAEFENYRLTLEYRWGTQKWAPRDQAPLDSGLLFHCVGPHGVQNDAWMLSQEFQIWEGQVGDYFSVGGGIADIAAVRPVENEPWIFAPAGERRQFGPWLPRALRDPTRPVPTRCNRLGNGVYDRRDGWNRLDLYALGGTSVQVVNGTVAMVLRNSRRLDEGGQHVPLTRGKIQLQSEGAEIFFRDLRWATITEIPAALLIDER